MKFSIEPIVNNNKDELILTEGEFEVEHSMVNGVHKVDITTTTKKAKQKVEDFIKENDIELKVKGEDNMNKEIRENGVVAGEIAHVKLLNTTNNNKIKYVEDNGYIIENEKSNDSLNEVGLIADKLKQVEFKNKKDLQEGYMGGIDKIGIYIDENGNILNSGLTVEQLSDAKEIHEMRPKIRLHKEMLDSNNIVEIDNFVSSDKVCFAKVRPTAKIPSKNVEDGGYDVYADFEDNYIIIHPHQTKMIPTGIASAFSDDYVFVARERGSSGTKGMAVRSGVVDSGYRGEWFVPITNVNNHPIVIAKMDFMIKPIKHEILFDILKESAIADNISDNYLKQTSIKDVIFYPYEKGICQFLLVPVPKVKIEEISFKELEQIPSRRGKGALGSSGK